jgi:hypothetical protein
MTVAVTVRSGGVLAYWTIFVASVRMPTSPIQLTAPGNPATKRVRGRKYTSSGGPRLFNPCLVHEGKLILHRVSFLLIVSYQKKGDPDTTLHSLEFNTHLLS